MIGRFGGRRATALVAASGVALVLGAASGVRLGTAQAQEARPKRQTWRGHISDEDAFVGRALSAGDVARLPAAYFKRRAVTVDYTYVQETQPDGRSRFVRREMSWTLTGSQGDDAFTETCQGGGSLNLGPSDDAQTLTDAQRDALQATCTYKKTAITIRMYGRLARMPPLPVIPPVEKLENNCSWREKDGTRETTVWLTPEVDAVVDLDVRPNSSYARFVPEPGQTVAVTARTVPAWPARFRFVIDPTRTSHFAGYAGNASVDETFFKRYQLEHLANEYKDDSPDLIFDKQMFKGKSWGRVDQDVVETAEDGGAATAHVTAMDFGAIGQVRAYAKFKCGGWFPAQVRVNGTTRDAVSVPVDEDHNLIADFLKDYQGLDPGSDDDAEPEGDGTKGDGLTAFEEYRGFMVTGYRCGDPVDDLHVRTSPKAKNLFVNLSGADLNHAAGAFAAISGLNVVEVCDRHLWGVDTVVSALKGFDDSKDFLEVPEETRVINFTLDRARQRKFEGHDISQGPQHGIVVRYADDDVLDPLVAIAVPTSKAALGPPRLTAGVLLSPVLTAPVNVLHELGHAVGVPHHADSRKNWRIAFGVQNVVPNLSPLQAAGILPDDPTASELPDQGIEALLIEPGPGCQENDPDAAYDGREFAGCITQVIVRRGQQDSGDVWCPMHYSSVGFFEPPGVTAVYRQTEFVTRRPGPRQPQSCAPDAASPGSASRGLDQRGRAVGGFQSSWCADKWGGGLLRWTDELPEPWHRLGRLCRSGRGTEENAREGRNNLAGDAGRPQGCAQFVVVNDIATKDPKQ